MNYFIVYQQILTKTKRKSEVKMLVRKVYADNRHKAIMAFKRDTEQIKRLDESKIGCTNFDNARTIKYKRKRNVTKK